MSVPTPTHVYPFTSDLNDTKGSAHLTKGGSPTISHSADGMKINRFGNSNNYLSVPLVDVGMHSGNAWSLSWWYKIEPGITWNARIILGTRDSGPNFGLHLWVGSSRMRYGFYGNDVDFHSTWAGYYTKVVNDNEWVNFVIVYDLNNELGQGQHRKIVYVNGVQLTHESDQNVHNAWAGNNTTHQLDIGGWGGHETITGDQYWLNLAIFDKALSLAEAQAIYAKGRAYSYYVSRPISSIIGTGVSCGTTSDRENLTYLEDGDVFYNTETSELQIYKNGVWRSLSHKIANDRNAFKITSGDSVPAVDSNSKEGNIFYNSSTGKIRIREESAWQVTSKRSIKNRDEFKILHGTNSPSTNTLQRIFYNTNTKKLQYLKNDSWRSVAEEEVAGNTFNVGVDSYKFTLNNAVQPELNLYRGNEYVFNQSSADNSGQRLFVSNDLSGRAVSGGTLLAGGWAGQSNGTASSSSHNGSRVPENAFNDTGGSGDMWMPGAGGGSAPGQYLTFTFNSEVKITRYFIVKTLSNKNLGSWKLHGRTINHINNGSYNKNDSSTYDEIDVVSGLDYDDWNPSGSTYSGSGAGNSSSIFPLATNIYDANANDEGLSNLPYGLALEFIVNTPGLYKEYIILLGDLAGAGTSDPPLPSDDVRITEVLYFADSDPVTSENTNGFTSTGTLGTDLVSKWTIPTDASDTMYYASDGSANAGGKINITDVPAQEKTFVVDVSLNRFTLDGIVQPTLNLYRDSVYKFDQSNASNVGQRLLFNTLYVTILLLNNEIAGYPLQGNDTGGPAYSSGYHNIGPNNVFDGSVNPVGDMYGSPTGTNNGWHSTSFTYNSGSGNNGLITANNVWLGVELSNTKTITKYRIWPRWMNSPTNAVAMRPKGWELRGSSSYSNRSTYDVIDTVLLDGDATATAAAAAWPDPLPYEGANNHDEIVPPDGYGYLEFIVDTPNDYKYYELYFTHAYEIQYIFISEIVLYATVETLTENIAGVTSTGTLGTDLITRWRVPTDASDTMYYTSDGSANFGGTINISDAPAKKSRVRTIASSAGSNSGGDTYTSYAVDVSLNRFIIGGLIQPTLNLYKDSIYRFDQSDPDNVGQRLFVSNDLSGRSIATTNITENTAGVTSTGTLGTDLITTWRIPTDASDTMYYASDGSSNAGGKINVEVTPYEEKTYAVDVSLNRFTLDGLAQPTLNLYRDSVYKFDQSDASNVGQRLLISNYVEYPIAGLGGFNGTGVETYGLSPNVYLGPLTEGAATESPLHAGNNYGTLDTQTPPWATGYMTPEKAFNNSNDDKDGLNGRDDDPVGPADAWTSAEITGSQRTELIFTFHNESYHITKYRLYPRAYDNSQYTGRPGKWELRGVTEEQYNHNINNNLLAWNSAYTYDLLHEQTTLLTANDWDLDPNDPWRVDLSLSVTTNFREYSITNTNKYRQLRLRFNDVITDDIQSNNKKFVRLSQVAYYTESKLPYVNGVTSTGTLGTDLITRWRVPTDALDTMYYASDGSANIGGTINLFNSTNDATPPTIVCLTGSSAVNVISSGGNKYRFNGDSTYVANKYYGLGAGTFTFTGVPSGHPIAILNAGKTSLISYTGLEANKSSKTVSGTTSDGTYDFYHGDVTVTVSGDFGSVSVYCYHHGYMGGENLLRYSSSCDIPTIVTEGLMIYLDAANYSGSGTTWPNAAPASSPYPDATLSGNPTYHSENGGVLDFQGSYAIIPTNTLSSPYNSSFHNFTYNIWVKPSELASWSCLVDQLQDDYFFGWVGYGVRSYNPNHHPPTDGTTGVHYRPGRIHTDTWYNLVLTHDVNRLRIYINAQLVETIDPVNVNYSGTTNNITFMVSGNWNEHAYGKLGIAMIYDRPLTHKEVLQNYNMHRERFGTQTATYTAGVPTYSSDAPTVITRYVEMSPASNDYTTPLTTSEMNNNSIVTNQP